MFNKYEVYTDVGSVYCYKGTSVLYNRFNIRNYETLKQVETDMVSVKQNYLLGKPINGKFTPNHLCTIHRYLFGDVYRFAGHFRTETVKKGSTTFLGSNEIPTKLSQLLSCLKEEHYLQDFSEDVFIQKLTYYFAELNYIHPFREGNGRAIREFIRELAVYNGYHTLWQKVETSALLDAMIESVYNTTDLLQLMKVCIVKL